MFDKREVDITEVFAWDARREELLTVRHNLNRSLFVDVTVWAMHQRCLRTSRRS